MITKWLRFRRGRVFMREVVLPRLERVDPVLADRIRHCGDYVYVAKCGSCGAKHFAGYTRCKSRFCVNCSRVMALLYFKQIMHELENEGVRYAYLLTLTLRDRDNLYGMISELRGYWRRFYNGRKRKLFARRFVGWFKALEIKKGKGSGKWHVHIHVLLAAKDYGRDYEWIREEWKKITGEEGSVHIKVANPIVRGVLEVCKYILKPSAYSEQEWKEVLDATRRVKRVASGGIFVGIRQRVERQIDKVEEEVLLNFVCRVCGFRRADLVRYLYSDLEEEAIWDIMGGVNVESGKGVEVVSGGGCGNKGRSAEGSLVEGEGSSSVRG